MSKKIPLTRGYVALVDDDDFKWLSRWKWTAKESHGRVYAYRADTSGPKQKNILMHREILNAPDGTQVDHIKGVGLDNRRQNLRLATHAQNQSNRGVQRNSTSGYKGVRFDKRNKKWYAEIQLNNKKIHLGCFPSPQEAAHAYDAAARKYHGEFAKANFQ